MHAGEKHCANLIGVEDGRLPEHGLETSHAANNMLDLLKDSLETLHPEASEQTYLDVAEDGLSMLGFLPCRSAGTRQSMRWGRRLTSCLSWSCFLGITSSRTSLTVWEYW